MSVVLLILGIVLFIGLVVVHEFGHFIVARRNGVEAEEFGVGFPPRAWSRKLKSGLLFSVNWLPIGGFVKLKGENDADKRPGSLGAATLWAKAKIMLAGVAMNLLVAFLLLTVLGWVGMPKLLDNQFTVKSDTNTIQNEVLVGVVEPDSPAAKAGLQPRDHLIAIAPLESSVTYYGPDEKTVLSQQKSPATKVVYTDLKSASQLPGVTQGLAGLKVSIKYMHKGQVKTAIMTLRSQAEVDASKNSSKPKGYMGITPTELTLRRSTWSAPLNAIGLIGQFTAATFQGLGSAIGALFQGDTARASAQVSGPVGIVVLLKDGSLLGYQFVLMIIAIISLTLAIMNVLPIPALDGGRLFVILLSRLFGKQLTEKMEERIVGTSFLLLLFIIGLITLVDVKRFF